MKNYKITLDVLTPVHIGNGNTIEKKDFEVKGNTVNIYDPLKLHAILGRSYEDFLMSNYTLTDFLRNNRVNVSKALLYSLPSHGISIRKSDGLVEFIKDPYGLPYIPGSSLKGAIRTAILSQLVYENKNNSYSSYANSSIDRRNGRDIEKQAFGDNTKSIFQQIKVSDSLPLSRKDLILCKKVDIFRDGNTNNKLNLCRESLKPGTEVTFSLTLDESLAREGDPYTVDFIMKAINNFSKEYSKEYQSKFSNFDNSYHRENIIYLGGGTGFLTKTINQSLYGKRTLERTSSFLDGKFRKHNHRKDVALGVSPRALKCTIVNNKTVEMGICHIRID